MKKAVKIIIVIALALMAFSGILFVAIPFESSFFADNSFMFITLIIVGVIGFITCLFVFFLNPLSKTDFFSKNITNLFEKVNNIKNTIEKNISSNENDEKPQKICCDYCKSKYSSSLDRCPNCGAPPNYKSK